jgi:hypothetical protein
MGLVLAVWAGIYVYRAIGITGFNTDLVLTMVRLFLSDCLGALGVLSTAEIVAQSSMLPGEIAKDRAVKVIMALTPVIAFTYLIMTKRPNRREQ